MIIRQNHIGDSPHNVAYVIAGMLHDTDTEPVKDWLNVLEHWYKLGRKYTNTQKIIGKDLQDKKTGSLYYTAWKQLSGISINENQRIYNRVGIKLSGKDIHGESFYYGFPLLAYDDYTTVCKTFSHTCYMTFPCSGDIQVLQVLSGGISPTIKTNKNNMILCNDGYYRYYDRDRDIEIDIDCNGPLNNKWFMKYGRCKW